MQAALCIWWWAGIESLLLMSHVVHLVGEKQGGFEGLEKSIGQMKSSWIFLKIRSDGCDIFLRLFRYSQFCLLYSLFFYFWGDLTFILPVVLGIIAPTLSWEVIYWHLISSMLISGFSFWVFCSLFWVGEACFVHHSYFQLLFIIYNVHLYFLLFPSYICLFPFVEVSFLYPLWHYIWYLVILFVLFQIPNMSATMPSQSLLPRMQVCCQCSLPMLFPFYFINLPILDW